MEPTFTAWTRIALKLIFSLSLFIGTCNISAQPVPACPSCGGGETCWCCDGFDPTCNCVPEEGSGTCGDEGDETGHNDAICATGKTDAEAQCNAGYPIPINSSIPLLAIAGISLMLVVLKVKL